METMNSFHEGFVVGIDGSVRKCTEAFVVQFSEIKDLRKRPFITRGCSSAGRAPALQAGGHGFDSHHLHQPMRIGDPTVGFDETDPMTDKG